VGCACVVAAAGCGRAGSGLGSGAGGSTGLGGASIGSGGSTPGGSGGSSSGAGGASANGGAPGTGGDSSGAGGAGAADGGGTSDGAPDAGFAAPLQPLKSYTGDGYFQSIAIGGGVVYVGRLISGSGGTLRQLPIAGIVALDEATLLPKLDWQPQVDTYVNDIVVSGSRVYIAGDLARNNLQVLDVATGAVLSSSYPVADSGVAALALVGGTMYFGGRFQTVGGAPRVGLGAFDVTTGSLKSWGPTQDNTGGWTQGLAISGNTIYASGGFTLADGAGGRRRFLAAIDATTGAVLPWNPNPSSSVAAMSISGNTLFVAGIFTTIAGQSRNHAAAFDVTTGALLPWDPDTDGNVRALAVHGGTVYLGGAFATAGGQPRRGLVAVDAVSAAVLPWNPIVLPPPPPGNSALPNVTALAVSDRVVAVGGAGTAPTDPGLEFFTPPP
jgi:hypothetical protein